MVRQPSRSEWSHIQALFAELIDLDPAAQEHRLAAEDDFIGGQLRALLAASRNSGILDGAAPSSFETAPRRAYSSLSEGAVIGGFTIDRLIGRGGMGEVYRAEQLDLARSVAFKQLHPGSTSRQRERFAREARLTAQLDHPSIVPVHLFEVARDGGPSGYVMKLVEGKTLRTLLAETVEMHERGAPIDAEHALSRRLEYFLKICDAIAFAHDRGVLHRDLKPANFMIGTFGEVYVMDWGVARPIGEKNDERSRLPMPHAQAPDLTQMGEVVGSPSYMSPEQADGRNDEVGPRSDQYALGLILFEIITLKRAIDGATMEEAFTLASTGQKAPFEHVSKRERIPPELRAVVEKATRYLPADRYESVQALADDVRRFVQGEAVLARRDNPIAKLFRWVNRHRRAALVLLAGVPMKMAVGTSLALIVINCAVGFAKYQVTLASVGQRVDWNTITVFAFLGMLGSLAGGAIGSKLDPRMMRRVFAVFLVLMAVYILWHQIGKL